MVGDAVGHVAVWKMAEFCLSDWSQLHAAVYEHERYRYHATHSLIKFRRICLTEGKLKIMLTCHC